MSHLSKRRTPFTDELDVDRTRGFELMVTVDYFQLAGRFLSPPYQGSDGRHGIPQSALGVRRTPGDPADCEDADHANDGTGACPERPVRVERAGAACNIHKVDPARATRAPACSVNVCICPNRGRGDGGFEREWHGRGGLRGRGDIRDLHDSRGVPAPINSAIHPITHIPDKTG